MSILNKLKERRDSTEEMSFIDHLDELRGHLFRVAIAIMVVGVVAFIYRDWVFDCIVTGPINKEFITYKWMCWLADVLHSPSICMLPVDIAMQTTTFGGQFTNSITLSIVIGLLACSPYIFWEFWKFAKPALKEKELHHTRFAIFWVSFFFLLGGAFGYFLLAPFTFNFLATFQLGTQHLVVTHPTLSDYLENITNIILGCGIAFELPVVSYVLTRLGLLRPVFLQKNRKYAVVIILVVAAVITPSPDWMSQMIVFIPLFILYEISILICKNVYKKHLKKEMNEWS